MFLTKIAQNVGPGPVVYSQMGSMEGAKHSIPQSTYDPSSYSTASMFRHVGPGAYETNQVKFLRTQPRVTIGNSKRIDLGRGKVIPGPDKYSYHLKMSDQRSISNERNAPRATIGRSAEKKHSQPTPGPSNYSASINFVGDEQSHKVPFTRQIRPISARPGQIKNIPRPGPADYKVVPTDVYITRRAVIPQATF